MQMYGPCKSSPKACLSWALHSVQHKTVYSSLSSIMCTKFKKKKNLTVAFCSAANSLLLEFPFCVFVHEVTPNVGEIRKEFIGLFKSLFTLLECYCRIKIPE